MIDEKTIKTYIGFNETIRKKWMKGRNMMKRGLAAFLTGIMTVPSLCREGNIYRNHL